MYQNETDIWNKSLKLHFLKYKNKQINEKIFLKYAVLGTALQDAKTR